MNTSIQMYRFVLVGLVSNILLYILYLLTTLSGVKPIAAMSLLYFIGVLQTFIFNKKWSFQHNGEVRSSFMRYIAAYLLGYIVNLTMLMMLVDHLGFSHQPVQGIMILVISLAMFLLQKHWVFPVSSNKVISERK